MSTPNDISSYIETALKRYPKANRLAVENFCFSAPEDKWSNKANLEADAKSYKWNRDTVCAIEFTLSRVGKLPN